MYKAGLDQADSIVSSHLVRQTAAVQNCDPKRVLLLAQRIAKSENRNPSESFGDNGTVARPIGGTLIFRRVAVETIWGSHVKRGDFFGHRNSGAFIHGRCWRYCA